MKTFKEYVCDEENKDPQKAYDKAVDLLWNHKEIPLELIDSFKNHLGTLIGFTTYLFNFKRQIPKNIIDKFIEDIDNPNGYSKVFFDLIKQNYNQNQMEEFLEKNPEFLIYI